MVVRLLSKAERDLGGVFLEVGSHSVQSWRLFSHSSSDKVELEPTASSLGKMRSSRPGHCALLP